MDYKSKKVARDFQSQNFSLEHPSHKVFQSKNFDREYGDPK